MSEEEEFEFRARAEAEASAPSAIASNATGVPKTQPQTTYNTLGQEAARRSCSPQRSQCHWFPAYDGR